MSNKICFYIRVSTEEQAKNLEGSIKNQKERLFEAVKFKNYSNDFGEVVSDFGEVVSVFIDRAKSGKDKNRPELQKMLYEISQGKIDLVMVSEISRISRNMKDFSEIWELMKKNNCGFYSLRENFDTTTAAGEMVLFTIANIAQFERRQVSERVAANIRARSKRGLYNGGCVPLGYKLNPDKKGYLEIDADIAELIKLCFKSFLEKETLSQTARYLNDNGHKIKRWKQGGGKYKRLSHFTVDNLHKILTSKKYLGIKTYKEARKTHEVQAVWDAIVDVDVFNRVNKKLKDNYRRKKPHSKSRFPYLLSGITFCKTCGDVMCGKSAHGNSGKVGYYEHSWATKRESAMTKKTFKCSPHRVQAKKLEPLILEKVEELLFKDELSKKLFEGVKSKVSDHSANREVTSTKSKIYGINSQLEALSERLGELPKDVPATPIYNQMKGLEAIRLELEKKIEDLLASNTNDNFMGKLNDFDQFTKSLKELWLNGTSEVKSKIIKRLVHRVEVGDSSVVVHYNVDKRNLGHKMTKASAREAFNLTSNFFYRSGSNSLTNGGPSHL